MYSMDDYAAAYEAGDYANAIAIWDDCAQRIYDFTCQQAGEAFRPDLPGILSSFMPKSGGTFLFNRLIDKFGYRQFPWGITRHLSMSEFYPTPNAVRCYQQGGVFCHTHALPSPWFRMMAQQVDLGTLWVHVRHPADACLSAHYHYLGLGQGEGIIADDRQRAIEEEKAFLQKKHGAKFNNNADEFLCDNIQFFCMWLTRIIHAERSFGLASVA